MRYEIIVPRGTERWSYVLLVNSDYQRIDVDGVVIIDIWKVHDHRYELAAFFYRRKVIVPCHSYGTKKELYGAIQKFLQEFL